MKKVKLKMIAMALLIMGSLPAISQHKIAMSSGIISFEELNEVSVEGYDGNEIIIETGGSYKMPERAKGLRPLNALGLTDNTGIGLAVTKDGERVVVKQVTRDNDISYRVKLPFGVMIQYKNSSIHGEDFYAKDIKSELEIQTHGGDIKLVNVTGPITASSVHGDIDVIFNEINQKLPSSIASVHGDVDVTIAATAKADLRIATNWGEVYSDLEIKVETSGDGMKQYGSKKISGKLNGGGVSLAISSTHGNVYLRKK